VDAFVLAQSARSAGLNVQMELAGRSRKGQMKQADRSGASYVAIFGDEAGGVVTLKDLQSGEQEELESTSVVARVLRGRHIG
jgi:histidyl-tRNA synthetase